MSEALPSYVHRNGTTPEAGLPYQGPERVLLVNPPVYDVRFHWARWHQPTLLLRLGTQFCAEKADVKLVEVLYHHADEPLPRQRLNPVDLDGRVILKWRFGTPQVRLAAQLADIAKSGWRPDLVYVECCTTFWREGAAEVIRIAKQAFPGSNVILLGAYARLAPEHAKQNTDADVVFTEKLPGVATLPADFSLYDVPPIFAYVSTGNGERTADDIADEVAKKAKEQKVRRFAFADHALAKRFPVLYREVLEKLAELKLRATFFALGNVQPSELLDNPDLPGLMKRAGYVQICFGDDGDTLDEAESRERLMEQYRRAAALCREAGFRPRTDQLIGAVSIGRRGEDLSARAKLATLVSHNVGSVILWPHQHPLEEGFPPELDNLRYTPHAAKHFRALAAADSTLASEFGLMLRDASRCE